jgi:hypothetical protein
MATTGPWWEARLRRSPTGALAATLLFVCGGGASRHLFWLRFRSLPPLRPQSPRIGFWRRRLRRKWALTEKARRRGYCTGLQASWSELAYVRPLCASETEPLRMCVAWVVVISAAGP